MITPIRAFVLTACSLSLASCNTLPPPGESSTGASLSTPALEVVSEVSLPDELVETSGLACLDDGVVTLNDSGNAPILYFVGEDGAVGQRLAVAADNRDWESLAADDRFFFVGDIGNNLGGREWLTIYRVARDSGTVAGRIDLTYQGYDAGSYGGYDHDYDGEAMVLRGGELLLFSKSWHSGRAAIYSVDQGRERQVLAPVAHLDGLPGVLTGADWDDAGQRFVLVGYATGALGPHSPFIALATGDFRVTAVYPLSGYRQTEGVCVTASGDIRVSEEGSPLGAARLIRIRLPR